MLKGLMKKFNHFVGCDEGVTLVEYGIALTLAVGFGVAALNTLGGAIAGSMGSAATQMP